jgi:hypothetical protein
MDNQLSPVDNQLSPVDNQLSPVKMFQPISQQKDGLIDFKNQFRRSSIIKTNASRGVVRKRKAQSARGKPRKRGRKTTK